MPPGISLRAILREASFYCVDIPLSAVRQPRTKHLFIQESWDSTKTQFTLFIRGNIDLSLVQELERYFTSIEVPETAKGEQRLCLMREGMSCSRWSPCPSNPPPNDDCRLGLEGPLVQVQRGKEHLQCFGDIGEPRVSAHFGRHLCVGTGMLGVEGESKS